MENHNDDRVSFGMNMCGKALWTAFLETPNDVRKPFGPTENTETEVEISAYFLHGFLISCETLSVGRLG